MFKPLLLLLWGTDAERGCWTVFSVLGTIAMPLFTAAAPFYIPGGNAQGSNSSMFLSILANRYQGVCPLPRGPVRVPPLESTCASGRKRRARLLRRPPRASRSPDSPGALTAALSSALASPTRGPRVPSSPSRNAPNLQRSLPGALPAQLSKDRGNLGSSWLISSCLNKCRGSCLLSGPGRA